MATPYFSFTSQWNFFPAQSCFTFTFWVNLPQSLAISSAFPHNKHVVFFLSVIGLSLLLLHLFYCLLLCSQYRNFGFAPILWSIFFFNQVCSILLNFCFNSFPSWIFYFASFSAYSQLFCNKDSFNFYQIICLCYFLKLNYSWQLVSFLSFSKKNFFFLSLWGSWVLTSFGFHQFLSTFHFLHRLIYNEKFILCLNFLFVVIYVYLALWHKQSHTIFVKTKRTIDLPYQNFPVDVPLQYLYFYFHLHLFWLLIYEPFLS